MIWPDFDSPEWEVVKSCSPRPSTTGAIANGLSRKREDVEAILDSLEADLLLERAGTFDGDTVWRFTEGASGDWTNVYKRWTQRPLSPDHGEPPGLYPLNT